MTTIVTGAPTGASAYVGKSPEVLDTLPPGAPSDPVEGAHGPKDFATVARDARAVLDAGAEWLGKKPNIHTTGQEWRDLFGGMDRRALYAVASNKDGAFSKDEQNAAAELMHRQLTDAMGVSSATWASGEHAAGFKSLVNFLDSVSAEEKGSLGWALNRASAERSYEVRARDEGDVPEDLSISDPLVLLLKAAMDAAGGDPALDRSEGPLFTIEDVKRQPWAAGFQDKIEQANSARSRPGSLLDIEA